MDHFLGHGCQDVEYDQTIGIASGSPRSRVLRRTYDAPRPALNPQQRPAYASHPTHISLRRMQSRTMMFTREPVTAQSSEQSLGNPVRRSVSGMKNLLPLKLLSPTASELGIWPSSAPSHRTTFGMRLSLKVEERRSSMNEHTDSQRARPAQRPRRYRDTPIFAEPGTPLPSPAYFTNDNVCLRCPPSGSICDETCIINDYDKEKKSRHEQELGDLQETIENICDGGDESLLQSYLETDSRCSELSFQCSGEDMFPDEAAWLRSPLNLRNWPRPNAIHQEEMSPAAEHNVENWLYDTSEYFDEAGDSLACATILAPAKASVVDVSLSPSSGLGLSIPPRTSSLDKPIPFPFPPSNTRDSWLSFSDSPPVTPADADNSNAPSREPSFSRKFQPLPRRRLDLAMTSPPMSPDFATLASPAAHNLAPSLLTNTRRPDTEKPSWPLTDNTLPESTHDILSSLQEWTTNFPSTMLLPDSSCMPAIRSQLSQKSSQPTMDSRPKTPKPLLSGFSLDSIGPPRMKSLRRRKTADVPQRRPSFSTRGWSTTQPPPLPSSSSSSKTITAHTLSSPDLQPIHNIFPNSSKTMRAALYAHVLAYIYVTSTLQTPPPVPSSPKQKRRNTPHWSSASSPMSQKSATFLGTASIDADSSVFTSEPPASSSTAKAQAMQEDLRKCIYCLISVMDENFGMENMMGSESENIERSSGMVFLRSLVEVVKSAEERAASSPSGFF